MNIQTRETYFVLLHILIYTFPLNEVSVHLKFPDIKIGRSIFCSFQPKLCVFPGSSGTHRVCVYKYKWLYKLMALKSSSFYCQNSVPVFWGLKVRLTLKEWVIFTDVYNSRQNPELPLE